MNREDATTTSTTITKTVVYIYVYIIYPLVYLQYSTSFKYYIFQFNIYNKCQVP